MRRAGRADVSGPQVPINKLTPVSESLYAVTKLCWWGAGVVGSSGTPASIRAAARSTDLRIPQIGTFFSPLDRETDDCVETGYALGNLGSATTNGRFCDFFESCEIVPPQTSEPLQVQVLPGVFESDPVAERGPKGSRRRKAACRCSFAPSGARGPLRPLAEPELVSRMDDLDAIAHEFQKGVDRRLRHAAIFGQLEQVVVTSHQTAGLADEVGVHDVEKHVGCGVAAIDVDEIEMVIRHDLPNRM